MGVTYQPTVRCGACHHDGTQCELPGPDHAGPHIAAEKSWYGTTPWRERQNAVFTAVLHGWYHVSEIMETTKLPRRTVRRMLHSLLRERLVRHVDDQWVG